MSKLIYNFIDVFAEGKYQGNQLAVFRNAGGLSDEEMQKIAREINFSETAFILSDRENNGGYDVRIFTPGSEVPFAGHPALGTAFVIQKEIIKKEIKKVVLNLKAGQIPVEFNPDGLLWMKQITPEFFSTAEVEKIAEFLGLDDNNFDRRFPIQEVSTGLPFWIVPLKNLTALKNCRINKDKLFDFVRDKQAKGILVFCLETRNSENTLSVRVFVDYYGVPEDPATGSGNGCLAGYLVKNRYFNKDVINIRCEQGYEIGRPSLLHLKAGGNEKGIDVFVGGKVVPVAEGIWE